MSCKLMELRAKLAGLADKAGLVNGIPLDVAVMRLTGKFTEQRSVTLAKAIERSGKLEKVREQGNKIAQKQMEASGKVEDKKAKMAETTTQKTAQTVGSLKTQEVKGDTKVMFADGSAAKTVQTYEDLVAFARDYEVVMNRVQGKKGKKQSHIAQMFKLLEDNGVEFRPLKVSLTPNMQKDSSMTGEYKESVDSKGTVNRMMQMYYNRNYKTATPAQVVLHEYAHAVTMTAINANPELAERIEELMKKVLEADPTLASEYGLKPDPKTGKMLPTEFVAEVIANKELQEKLDRIEVANEAQSIADAVIAWFKDVLENLRGKDISKVTALTKALELAIEAMQSEVSATTGNASYNEDPQLGLMPKGTKQYHISDASFDKFAVAGDEIPGYGKLKTVGSHIGEVESAKEYEKQQTWSKGEVKYEVTANADVNTLEMTDPGDSNWTADTMYDELVEKYGEVPFTKESDAKEVLEFLRDKGIDAIKYKNTAEAGVSYMVVNPEKFDLKKIEEWPSKAEAKQEDGKIAGMTKEEIQDLQYKLQREASKKGVRPYGPMQSMVDAIDLIIKPLKTESERMWMEKFILGELNTYTAGKYSLDQNTMQLGKYPSKEAIEAAVTERIETEAEQKERSLQNVAPESFYQAVRKTKTYKELDVKRKEITDRLLELLTTAENQRGTHAMLHEYIHAATLDELRHNPKSREAKRIKELYEIAIGPAARRIDRYTSGNDYWKVNVEEFIAEALSNPGLVRGLQSVNVKLPDGKFTSLFKDLYDMIMKAIGFSEEDSLYAYALDGVTAILEKRAKDDIADAARWTQDAAPEHREAVSSLKELINKLTECKE